MTSANRVLFNDRLSVCLLVSLFVCFITQILLVESARKKIRRDGSWCYLDPTKFRERVTDTNKIGIFFPFIYYYVSWHRYVLSECSRLAC